VNAPRANTAAKRKPAKRVPAKRAVKTRAPSKSASVKRTFAPRLRETREDRARRALAILERLSADFPDAACALRHETPHQLLVATILSAQCTDARVNQVTPELFRKYPSAQAFSRADLSELESDIRSTGFFRMKARAIVEMSRDVLARHRGEVPRTMDELVQLRGVGRKTANVVLGNAFGIPGVVVDTHVGRLARRMGLTRETDPVKVERDLDELWPKSWWTLGSHLLILHGRKTCSARAPKCPACCAADLCPSAGRV
jgi:endonuclease-3